MVCVRDWSFGLHSNMALLIRWCLAKLLLQRGYTVQVGWKPVQPQTEDIADHYGRETQANYGILGDSRRGSSTTALLYTFLYSESRLFCTLKAAIK